MAPPRNVIFDVGNVLLRWDPKALMELEVANPALRESLLQVGVGGGIFDCHRP